MRRIQATVSDHAAYALADFEQDIIKEITIHQELYSQYFQQDNLIGMLKKRKQIYLNQQEVTETIRIVLEVLSYCKNQSIGKNQLPTTLTEAYSKQIALRWQKIREPAFFFNKGHLRILSFLVKEPKSGRHYYDLCWQDLRFDFSQEECEKLALTVKRMCKEDLRAFCYLSNYFLKCCYLMEEKENKQINSIESTYIMLLNHLCKQNRPAPKIQAEQHQFEAHKSFNYEHLLSNPQIDLRKYSTREQKQEALDNLIMEMAQESKGYYQKFVDLIKNSCENNGGYHFKAGIKIKDKIQTKALIRIKEKMLGGVFKEVQLKKKLSVTKNAENSGVPKFRQYVLNEQREYEKKMEKLFNTLEKPIQFKVTDMLRGKCMFASIHQINKCCTDIKSAIMEDKTGEIKLIQIDNRLNNEQKGTSDLVLKILFGRIVAELQLVIDLDTAEYQFSHLLYELARSKFFSPVTQLFILNERISEDYIEEVKEIIEANQSNAAQNYEETVSYKQIVQYFADFSSKIRLKEKEQSRRYQIEVQLMDKQKKWFQNIKQLASGKIQIELNLILRKKGDYCRQIKQYEKAKEFYQQCLQIQQSKKGKGCIDSAMTLNNIGLVYDNQGDYAKAIEFYQRCLQIQQKVKGKGCIDSATALNNIAGVYDNQGDYPRAIKFYQRCLQIQQKIKGKGCIDSATTLNNIASVYDNQGDYQKAIEFYQRCLQIQQKIKGKGCIDSATTLNNIAGVYKNQTDYSKAIEYYQRCLQIQQKGKGKGCIDSATTLNNIASVYDSQGDYPRAIEFYQRCLQIQQKVKGKGCIDSAMTLNNIAGVYKSQVDYPRAIEFYQRCLQLKQKLKGKGCIDSAMTLNNIANVYYNQGYYSKAIEFYQRCLQIQQKVKGKDCIESATALNNIFGGLSKLQDFERTEQNNIVILFLKVEKEDYLLSKREFEIC